MKGIVRTAIAAMAMGGSVAMAEVRLQGAGSTFVAPMMQRWVSEYQKQHPEVKIDYQSIGSGGGVKAFLEKTVDFGASDAPLSKKEYDQAGGTLAVIQVPVIAGAVVAGYNLPGFNGDLKLDGATLADMFQGKIKKWNDPKIASLNAGMTLPSLAITPAHRTDGSGTTFIFTSYLSTQSTEFKEKVGASKQVEWPGGSGGKGNEGVTQVVQSTPGAIGYIELAYALQNKIPFAVMKNADGQFVKASPESTSAAGEQAAKQMDGNNAAPLWNQHGAGVYPIAGFTYVFVRKDLSYMRDKGKAQAVAGFLAWVTHDGQQFASSLDYAPLSGAVRAKAAHAIAELNWSGTTLSSAGR
jgi:phosphate transport system substrate-binding protein